MNRLLITAGPTHEAIDEVRYVANRSSGRMGIALAEAARDAGWSVTLLLGPVGVDPPTGVTVEDYVSTADLEALLDREFLKCDVLIMAAAVADYRPSTAAKGKLARKGENLVLTLEPTPDLVARCAARRKPHQRIIGFALEEESTLETRATEKLQRKNLDALVANPISTLEAKNVSASVYFPDGRRISPSLSDSGERGVEKSAFAKWLMDLVNAEFPLST